VERVNYFPSEGFGNVRARNVCVRVSLYTHIRAGNLNFVQPVDPSSREVSSESVTCASRKTSREIHVQIVSMPNIASTTTLSCP